MKTDRKAEYTKLKAKQIEDELEKKNFIVKKQAKSQTKQ